ncbi:MAG: choice-of-anchor J domain-containing protein [Bacteroidales bacterium]
MKRKLFVMWFISFCLLSIFSVAQNVRNANIPVREIPKVDKSKAVSPNQTKGKPLVSPVFLKSYRPQHSKSFESSTIGFNKKESNKPETALMLKALDDTIYGNMVYSDAWQDLALYETPYGLYSFTANEEAEFNLKYKNVGLACNAGTYAQGKFYGIHPILLFGSLNGIGYYVVNTETWELENSFIKEEGNYDDMASCITYDKSTNTIYALRYNSDLTGLNWATMDPTTFTFTNLNEWLGNFDILTLTTTPAGVIYAIGDDGNLYTLDKSDGKPTLVGSTGVIPAKYTQSTVYNGKTNSLLWAAITYTKASMYSVNLSTGEATKLYNFPNNEQFVGLFTKVESAADAAPMSVNDLALTFDAPGELTGKVTFTLPSTTYSGSPLSGNLHVITKIDGVVAEEKDLASGSSYSLDVTLTNDNHTISVITSNSAGSSPVAVINKFAGYDRPKAVGNLSMQINNGVSQLSWDAPTVGINEGYVNADSVYYKVIRYPGNIVVADKLKAVSFSETLPTIMARYYYNVISYNGSEKEGVTATSNNILYGDGFIPPYSEKFEVDTALYFFNVIDANGDGYLWQKLYNVVACWPNSSQNDDDWLISPALELEKGIKYKLVFSTKALFSPAVESMKVALGTSQTDTSTFTRVLWDNPQIDFYEYTDQTVEFSVTENGKYYIGFHAYTLAGAGNGLYIDDISLDVIGALIAPSKVQDLSVEPDANDALKATVSFTLPSTNLSDETITTIDSVCIFRNDNLSVPIHSIINPTPASTVSWTDENISQVGVVEYTVVAYVGSAKGESTSSSAFVGVYTAPYSETFDNSSALNLYSLVSSDPGYQDWKYYNGGVALDNWMTNVNDWMILPALKLDAETVYEFSVDYMTYGVSAFNLTLGRTASPDDQQTVQEFPNTAIYSPAPITGMFSTNEEGKYYVGLNIQNDRSKYYWSYILLDNIKVTRLASTKAPGIVTNLNLQADKNGQKVVTISFNAPSIGYNGGSLESISKIDIYRANDITPSKTFESPTLGQELSWTDSNVPNGYVKYAIFAENAYGQGRMVVDSIYVGPDKPSIVRNLTMKADANNQNVTISWQKPLSVNNGYLDYSSITYNVYKYNASIDAFDIVKEGVTDTVCFVEENVTGAMSIYYYAVSPVLNDYEAEAVVGHTVLGTPYNLPLHESFADGTLSTNPWVVGSTDYSGWTVIGGLNSASGLVVDPQDNDQGMLFFYTYNLNSFGIVDVPKVRLTKKNGVNNYLKFWIYQGSGIATSENAYVVIKASADDESFVNISDTIRVNNGDGWTPYTIRLDDYKSSNYLTIRIFAHINDYSEGVGIDNISVYSLFSNDMAVNNISGPEAVEAATDATYSVNIVNAGYTAIAGADYSVKLYNGNELIESKSGVDLASEETSSYSFTINPSVAEVGNVWQLSAKVEYAQDQAAYNNVSDILEVSIESSGLPCVTDLSASTVDDNVQLSWSQPNLGYSASVTEGFEDYDAFIIDNIGNWKLVDGDGQYTGWINVFDYANAGEAQAYMVWNQKEAGAEQYDVLAPHSGNQCLISWTAGGVLASDGSSVEATNDDWLISPEIKGGSLLSFWAAQPSNGYGYEKFEIWISSTTNDVESFSKLDGVQLTVINWTYYSFNLPADAKYFAIRHTSTSCFALMIDDISYVPADAEVVQYNLLGYNLYRNDEKISDQLITNTSEVDTPASSSTYVYAVSAVYDNGESDLSNKVTINYIRTGVNDNVIDGEKIIGSKGEVILLGMQGKFIKVFTVDGKQVATFNCTSQRQTRGLYPGIYVVTASDGVASKVVVY